MNISKLSKPWNARLVPRHSIQKRLPLFICFLLLSTIIAFGYTSYLGMKNSALEVGRQRVNNLSDQLSSMFQQSAQALLTATRTAAGQPGIKNYVVTGGKESRKEALEELQAIRKDTTSVLVQILDTNRTPVLVDGKEGIRITVNSDSVLRNVSTGAGVTKIGKIYLSGDSMFHPIVAAITDNNKLIGYLIRWRLVLATPKTLEQLSQLIGTGATLYFGNTDGNFWTDLIKPIPAPPIDKQDIKKVIEYTRRDGSKVMATVRPVNNSNWLIMVELSTQKILEGANSFLYWVIIIGTILVVAAMFAAWMMSRTITRPLNALTNAAAAVAAGNYSPIEISRKDELGKLAIAFNSMALRVNRSKQELEKEVLARTAQLEIVNKELEAFSYSVSHDLRAPLRALSGYSTILKEDYGEKLDAEAIRIINAIITNANMMGNLIDDLIEFSRVSKKEVSRQLVDMKELAESCLAQLLNETRAKEYQVQINSLPACRGDKNMIRQVWMNLISNALKYSSEMHGPCIEINFKEDLYRHVYFIKDNGVGFDMQYVHKLFGVFQRLHSQDTFEGTGVGLALAKRIIAKHDGEIWAESILGQGATFYFSLPKTHSYE